MSNGTRPLFFADHLLVGVVCLVLVSNPSCSGHSASGSASGNVNAKSRAQASPSPSLSVSSLTLGDEHGCVLVNGVPKCWGTEGFNALGDGNSSGMSNGAVVVSGLSSAASQVSAGYGDTCAVVGGAGMCWGSNYHGQQGNGDTVSGDIVLTPTVVSGLGSGVTQIASSYGYTCAIVNGGLKCWGSNYWGRLGIGNNTSVAYGNLATVVAYPSDVVGLTSGVSAISTNIYNACALSGGNLSCWGFNGFSELGQGATSHSSVPVNIGFSATVSSFSAGVLHICAVEAGILKCLGGNQYGQLGIGSTDGNSNHSTPAAVSSINSVTQVSAGYGHTCAVSSGVAKCWGSNNYGQLGDGTTADKNVPVTVSGLSGEVKSVVASPMRHNRFSCALLASGSVQCWGSNAEGQLGFGSSNALTPVQVSGLF